MNLDPKLIQALSPRLQRILVVDPDVHSVRLLSEVLRDLRAGRIWTADTTAKGLSMAETVDPQLIFVEFSGPELDGVRFTRRLRRSNFGFRKAPVIMTTTSGMHLAPPNGAQSAETVVSPDSEATLNGNSVVLEEQMMKMSEARTDYNAAIGFYQRSLGLLQLAIKRPNQ